MSKITIDEFNAFAISLPENVNKRKLAMALGLELPRDPIPTLDKQLEDMKVIKHSPKTDGDKQSVERMYIEIPALKLDGTTGTRKVWIRAEIAREAFKKGLELCDKHNL